MEHKMCVLILPTPFLCNIPRSKKIITIYPFFLSDLNENWIFSPAFRKKWQPKFHEIRPEGAVLFLADGRTNWHDEAHRRFSQFY